MYSSTQIFDIFFATTRLHFYFFSLFWPDTQPRSWRKKMYLFHNLFFHLHFLSRSNYNEKFDHYKRIYSLATNQV